MESYDRIFTILGRIIHIPMHQYARYFERFRQLAQSRPLTETCPSDVMAQFRAEIELEAGGNPKSQAEFDAELRTRIDNHHLEIFHLCQTETTKRWTFEQEIKRPYFHVTDLDDAQLVNWRKYLDWEESEGDYIRISFLYERCLVAAAYYDEFWLRYARWMLAQIGRTEEVRNIYQRASCFYAPIARPTVRLQWALFEEMNNRVDVAHAIYEAMLLTTPGHVETIVAWANSQKRHAGIDDAIAIYQAQIESPTVDSAAKAALVASWARLVWKIRGSVPKAREIFQRHQKSYLDSRDFWTSYIEFEMEQPVTSENEAAQHQRIKQIAEDVRRKSQLPAEAVKELSQVYMAYLLERGTKDVAKEYMGLDREINGYTSSK